jgi:hypothetical protein
MGRGLALEFKKKYPDNFKAYASTCKRGGRFITTGTAKKISMTPTRAVLISLIKNYLVGADPFITLLEIHKLKYLHCLR